MTPIDDAKRTRAAQQARLRRRKAKLKTARDDAELEQLMRDELRAENDDAPLATVTPIVPAQPEAPPAKVGWPADEAIRAHEAHAKTIWEDAARALKGTRYEVNGDQLKVLVEGTAPMLAKYLPMLGDTPEAGFCVALGVVFLPKLGAHVVELAEQRAKAALQVRLGNVEKPAA